MSKEKRSEIIHDALNFLDDEMIEDVEKLRKNVINEKVEHGSTSTNWRKWTALAASVCVLIAGTWIYEAYLEPADQVGEQPESWSENFTEENDIFSEMSWLNATELWKDYIKTDENAESLTQESAENESDSIYEMPSGADEVADLEGQRAGVTIPQMKVNLKKAEDGIEVDMLGFFILGGRSYIQYEFQNDYAQTGADFVGNPVGHITGMIDEWTRADGYVEGAGTYTGQVYEVKGVSPEFMLCMVGEDGSVETFINHNDITLYKGSDLVDDWLDLRGNVDAISVETSIDGQIAYRELSITEEEMAVFEGFLNAFADGDFVYVEEKLKHPFGGDMDTPDMMDFYFEKEDGLRLRFRTLGDGYVSFPWIDACVQIDQELYDEVVEVLTENTR